jgi:hypothetical protein
MILSAKDCHGLVNFPLAMSTHRESDFGGSDVISGIENLPLIDDGSEDVIQPARQGLSSSIGVLRKDEVTTLFSAPTSVFGLLGRCDGGPARVLTNRLFTFPKLR